MGIKAYYKIDFPLKQEPPAIKFNIKVGTFVKIIQNHRFINKVGRNAIISSIIFHNLVCPLIAVSNETITANS